jgi:acetylornithine deacetylase/succinyl-diaminopimelate desuccinylase-like protein
MAKAIERVSAYRSPLRRTGTTESFIRGIAAEQSFPKNFFLRQLLNPAFSQAVEKRIPDAGLRGMVGAILRNTFVPTMAQAGRKTNVIPSECSCEVDCRILPGVTPEMVKTEMKELLSDLGDYTLEVTQTSPASESPTDNPLYQTFTRVLKGMDPKGKMIPTMLTGATDSRGFRNRGAVAYGFHPMAPIDNLSEFMGRIHGHDERIGVDSLLFGIRVLHQVLKGFCG